MLQHYNISVTIHIKTISTYIVYLKLTHTDKTLDTSINFLVSLGFLEIILCLYNRNWYFTTYYLQIKTKHNFITTSLPSRSFGDDPHGLGRWYNVTPGGNNIWYLTIINKYRECKQNGHSGVSAASLQ